MARIVYIIGELAGSISGLTFQRNSSGTIVRSRPGPTKRTTTRQTATHTAHVNWLYQWQQLTQTQRDDWNAYAALYPKTNKWGQNKTLTGQNWFESVNYHMADISEPIFASPPPHDLPQAPPSFTIEITAADIKLNMIDPHNYTVAPVLVWVSPPTKRNTPTINQTRRLGLIIENLVTNPIDITTQWETAIGIPWTPSTLFPNANIFVCLQSIQRSSGITSALLCDKANTLVIIGNALQADDGQQIQTDGGTNINTDS